MSEFSGRRVLVTGASRGAGAAIAKAFAKAGATVVLAARSEERLTKVKADIEADGGTAEMQVVDVSTRQACRDLAARCAPIDILINNAAITKGKFGNVLIRDDEHWDQRIAVNFLAPLTLMQELGEGMVERGHGVILNISSMSAQRPVPENAPANVMKAALDTLSKSAGMELARSGVRVNSIALGHVNTEGLVQNLPADLTADDVARRNSPLGRAITPEEIAHFCVYVASDFAAPILGTVLTIDGGLTAGSFSFSQSFGTKAQGN